MSGYEDNIHWPVVRMILSLNQQSGYCTRAHKDDIEFDIEFYRGNVYRVDLGALVESAFAHFSWAPYQPPKTMPGVRVSS